MSGYKRRTDRRMVVHLRPGDRVYLARCPGYGDEWMPTERQVSGDGFVVSVAVVRRVISDASRYYTVETDLGPARHRGTATVFTLAETEPAADPASVPWGRIAQEGDG